MTPADDTLYPSEPDAPDPLGSRDAIDALNRQNRVLLEARMLPRTQLTDEQVDDVRQSFVAYLKANHLNFARVADPIGYKPSTLSEWASGKYGGDNSAVARKVNDWIERDSRRAKSRRPAGYIPTQVAEDMRSLILTADKSNMMAAIVAPSGSGKTFVLKSLVDSLNGLYLRCDESCSPRELLLRIAALLGDKASLSRTRSKLQSDCVRALESKRHVLFLDEAHQLPPQTISLVRTLHDLAGVTAILVGTDAILDAINDRVDGRGQFSRRCIRYNLLDYVRNVDVTGRPGGQGVNGQNAGGRDLFSVEEVQEFFAMKRIRLSRDGLEMLWLIACLTNYGTLGFAEKVASIAVDISSAEEPIDRATVIDALRLVMGQNEFGFFDRLIRAHYAASTASKPKIAEAAATA